MPRLPPSKNERSSERTGSTKGDCLDAEDDDRDELSDEDEEEENSELGSETDESDDEESLLDLTGLEVFAFLPEGSGGKLLGKLGCKISSGSYGSVYEFDFSPERFEDEKRSASRRGKGEVDKTAETRREEPDVSDGGGWVAKVTTVASGFAPADLLRECQTQSMLLGHPGAPEVPDKIERRYGEVSLREVDKRRRVQMDEDMRRRLEKNWNPSDRHAVVIMRDAGITLEDSCREVGSSPLARYEILRASLPRVLSVLTCLHSTKIAHRDIKLNNILVDPDLPEVSTLIDFGLGKRLGRRNSERIGALGYRSPETIDWDRDDYDLTIDLFAVGCCFLLGMEEKMEDANATDDVESLKSAEKRVVRRLKTSGWRGAAAWSRVLQDFLHADPRKRSSASVALEKLRKGNALMPGFYEQHLRWYDDYRNRAKAKLSFGPESVVLDPGILFAEEGREAALEMVSVAQQNFGVPKIVATRTLELLDASFEAGFANGISGKRRLNAWRLAAASAFYLVSQYFEASGLAEPESVASEFGVSVSSIREFHWKILQLVEWTPLRASSHLQSSDSLGPDELYEPELVCRARRAVCQRPGTLIL